jgi:DNA-binding GntR family transcriptional regulator
MAPRLSPPRETRGSLAERAVLAVREMVRSGVLLPGAPVRQARVAEQLGMSRVPVREALKNLQAEGLVEAAPSGGFVVVRLSADELSEIYLMRRLLETEMLRRAGTVWPGEFAAMEALNERMADLVDHPSRELRALNRRFHFAMFALSGLPHVMAETRRLWDRTDPYRSIYSVERSARERIVAEHRALLAAVRAGDAARLVEVMDAHRGGGQDDVIGVLSRPSPGREEETAI